MAFSRPLIACVAMAAALGACTTMEAPAQDAAATAGVYAGRSVLDVAIEAAGGEAALSRVQELYWTGAVTVTSDGTAVEQSHAVLLRPYSFYRVTSWAKGTEPKTAKTVQAEQNKAWDVTRVTWQPMPEAGARFENEQLRLFSAMLLTSLKAPGVTVTDQPAAADGTRAIDVVHPSGLAAELELDAAGKLVRAGYNGTDPKTGEPSRDVYTFSGEIVSNGVKWPKHIAVTRNGAPWYEIEIATFEALPQKTVRPLAQAMQYDPNAAPSGDDDAG